MTSRYKTCFLVNTSFQFSCALLADHAKNALLSLNALYREVSIIKVDISEIVDLHCNIDKDFLQIHTRGNILFKDSI